MWAIFKVLIEFVTVLFLFYVLGIFFFFWLGGLWYLSSLTRDGTCTPAMGRKSSPLGHQESPSLLFNKSSLTRWTWVWVNSGSWWWTGRPGMLRFVGLQRVGHDWATELNWTESPCPPLAPPSFPRDNYCPCLLPTMH